MVNYGQGHGAIRELRTGDVAGSKPFSSLQLKNWLSKSLDRYAYAIFLKFRKTDTRNGTELNFSNQNLCTIYQRPYLEQTTNGSQKSKKQRCHQF